MKIFEQLKTYLKSDAAFITQSGTLFTTSLLAAFLNYLYQFSMGRLLGPADYGVLGAFSAMVHFFLAITNTIQTVTAKFVSVLNTNSELSKIGWLLRKLSTKTLLAGFGLFFFFLIISGFIGNFLNIPKSYLVMFSTFFIALFLISGLRGVLQGLQKFRSLGLNVVFEATLKIGIALGLILLGLGISGAIISFGAAMIITTAFSFVPLAKTWRNAAYYELNTAEIYRYSMPVFVAMTAITAFYTLDIVLVKHFLDATAAGHYAAASILAKIIFFGSMSISQVMFPKISELYTTGQNYRSVFGKAVALTGLLAATGAAIYYLFPKFVVSLLFGPDYYDIIPIIGLFGLAISLFSISFVFVNYFLAINKTDFVYLLILFVVAELTAIWFYHNSILQIIRILLAIVTILLASLVLYFFLSLKTENASVNNNSSI